MCGPGCARRCDWRPGIGATVLAVAACGLLLPACRGASTPTAPTPTPVLQAEPQAPSAPPPPPPVLPIFPTETLVGAGDIAICGSEGAERTAALLDGIAGTVFTAGDNTYPSGTERSFKDCYGPTWGRHRARTRPAPGNHDYDVPGAAPYFQYFGANAGDGRGYYSYRLGAWLVLSLNSNVPSGAGSPQYEWARAALAAHETPCALAYWHHPVVSSGPNGDHPWMQPMWQVMASNGVELVVSGHDHLYERFAPMDGGLGVNPSSGVRLFVAGTGGARPYPVASVKPLSEVRASVWGVLELTLRTDGYDWRFVSVPGIPFADAGSSRCH